MTLSDIEALPHEFLSISTVAEYLGSKEQPVREAIRRGVPWGYVVGKARFVIPRLRFVAYHKGLN